jgi:holo-[acyl-carrier protein] synthase
MDIHGTGVDLIEIDRIKQAVERFGSRITERVFSAREIEYCMGKSNPYPHLAARFAAKEAFIKSLAPLPITGINLKDIELTASGGMKKPELLISGEAALILGKAGIKEIKVSVSHSRNYAVATVILTK